MQDPGRPSSRRGQQRWGLRVLACLVVALGVVLTSSDGYSTGGALLLIVSLGAAAYCSYRGVRQFRWLPR